MQQRRRYRPREGTTARQRSGWLCVRRGGAGRSQDSRADQGIEIEIITLRDPALKPIAWRRGDGIARGGRAAQDRRGTGGDRLFVGKMREWTGAAGADVIAGVTAMTCWTGITRPRRRSVARFPGRPCSGILALGRQQLEIVQTGIDVSFPHIGAVVDGNDLAAAKTALKETISLIDKMASKGIIHRNAAGRYKSRLTTRLAARA